MCKAFSVKRQNVKAKFSSDEDLSLNKAIEIHNATLVVKIVFMEITKYYLQVFLIERLFELLIIQKCYIMIESTFLKELILIRQANQKNVKSVTIGIS